MSVFKLRNRADYAYKCPANGCHAKEGRPCTGRDVQGGLVHFGRRLIRLMHERGGRRIMIDCSEIFTCDICKRAEKHDSISNYQKMPIGWWSLQCTRDCASMFVVLGSF